MPRRRRSAKPASAATPPIRKPGNAMEDKYAAVISADPSAFRLYGQRHDEGTCRRHPLFPGLRQVPGSFHGQGGDSLAPWDVLSWALTNFSTVAEVKAALGSIAVIDVGNPIWVSHHLCIIHCTMRQVHRLSLNPSMAS